MAFAYVFPGKDLKFPISRDPPEGGTGTIPYKVPRSRGSFQFLGIPPKGERETLTINLGLHNVVSNF